MRPHINSVRHKDWINDDGTVTAGIALHHKRQRVAQLSPAEAYALADRLVDLAESLEAQP